MTQSLKLFVNYRRADHPEFVEHMRSWFMYRYGRENVFMDFDTIPPFTRFEDFIKTKVQECDAVVTVIGPRWAELLREHAASGKPDYVRIELEEALAYGKVVAPICIHGAPMPADEDIPETLRPVFARNVATLRSAKDILDYIDGIMDALEAELASQGWRRTVENPAVPTSVSDERFSIYEAVDLYYKAVDVQDWPGALILLARMRGAGVTVPDFFNLEQEEKQLQAQIKAEEEARRRREVAEYLYGFVRVMAHHGQDIRAALKEIWAVEPSYDPDRLAVKSKTIKKKPTSRDHWWNNPRTLIPGVLVISVMIVGSIILLGGSGKNPPPITQTSAQASTEPVTQIAEITTASPLQVLTKVPTNQSALTQTSDPTPTVAQRARMLAEAGVTRNADWVPYIEDLGDVKMALVPKGCFMMGSNDGEPDEKPIHQVCFEKPFWIDVTEVTNVQYGSVGCAGVSSRPEQPRTCVSWTDSVAYCEKRGARLPTEAEWEYAARGPDGLVYPWGNDFVANNAVYNGNSSYGVWEVGSKSGGVSWVGPNDLSGNASEAVNDWYSDTYYTTLTNGAVNPQGPSGGTYRVVRGGSWGGGLNILRAAYRGALLGAGGDVSFRCAHSY